MITLYAVDIVLEILEQLFNKEITLRQHDTEALVLSMNCFDLVDVEGVGEVQPIFAGTSR